MQNDAQKLLDLTYALADAVERGDLEDCAQSLARRGRFLADLADRRGDGATPPELEAAFATVRRMDKELEAALSERRDELGHEISRLGHTKNREAESAPRCMDLKA